MSAAGLDPATAFPVPLPDADTQPFWQGCERGELLIQRCANCKKWLWQPRPICSACQTPGPVWTRVSGDGFVASWTVLRPPSLPAFAEKLPYVVLLVELDEGVRLLGFLVDDAGGWLQTDGEAEGIRMGTRVSLRFCDQVGTILPSWTVAS